MKKLLILAAAAALLLASCAKVETTTKTGVDENIPIAFSNYTPRSITKAGASYIEGTTLVTNQHFGVYAWSTTYGNFLTANPGTPNFMNPVDVTYAGNTTDGSTNTYSPIRYWPSGEEPDNLSFVAYYPYGGAGITAPTFSANTVGVYAFEAQATPAAMVGFCVSDVINDQVYGSTNKDTYKGTVNLPFKHQLTKVQFKFKKATGLDANTTIELLDAKLYNIQTTGTLTATFAQNANPAVNALGTTTTDWSNVAIAATPVVYDVTLNGADPEDADTKRITLTETASTVAATDIFLMVPQTMIAPTFSATPNTPNTLTSAAQYLLVTWKVTTGNVSTTNTKALYLDQCVTAESGTTQANIDWAKNNFVTYTITIGPKPIWFTATVTGWNTEQNAYFDVQ